MLSLFWGENYSQHIKCASIIIDTQLAPPPFKIRGGGGVKAIIGTVAPPNIITTSQMTKSVRYKI